MSICENCQFNKAPVCTAPVPAYVILATARKTPIDSYKCPCFSEVKKPCAVSVYIDSDDDFCMELAGSTGYSVSANFETVEEAIQALKAFKVTSAGIWTQEGNRFTRSQVSEPEEFWFYRYIYEAITALECREDYSHHSNQTLEAYIYH